MIKYVHHEKAVARLVSYEKLKAKANETPVYRVTAAYQGSQGEVEFINYFPDPANVAWLPTPDLAEDYGQLSGQVDVDHMDWINSSWALLPQGHLVGSFSFAIMGLVILILGVFQIGRFLYFYYLRFYFFKHGVLGWGTIDLVKISKNKSGKIFISYTDGVSNCQGRETVYGSDAAQPYLELFARQAQARILYIPGRHGRVLLINGLG